MIIKNKELAIATPEKLEDDINYNFTNKDLLIEALSHPSLKQHIPKNGIQKNYERLELLGDAIINFAITEILFKNNSTYDEGKLAKIRSYLVSKELLCKIAARISLSDYIIMTSGEEILGGRKNLNNIENTMEALIAAIYLDSNIDNTKQIIYNLWQEFISITDLTDYDPKSTLQELAQKHGIGKPVYEVLKKEGLAHSPIFTIIVRMELNNTLNYTETATGHTVKEGEKNAARKLINILKSKIEIV